MKILHSKQSGFGPLAIIIVIAIIALAGGGAYYAKKAPTHHDDKVVGGNVESTTTVGTTNDRESGSIRSLLAMNKDLICTISNSSTSSASYSGTVNISGNMMHGHFTMTSKSGSSIESNMIRNGDEVIAWTGNQGAKINLNAMASSSHSENSTSSNVNLDQKVNYHCEQWVKDASVFTVPASVHIMDMTSMMNSAHGSMTVPADIQAKIKAGIQVGK